MSSPSWQVKQAIWRELSHGCLGTQFTKKTVPPPQHYYWKTNKAGQFAGSHLPDKDTCKLQTDAIHLLYTDTTTLYLELKEFKKCHTVEPVWVETGLLYSFLLLKVIIITQAVPFQSYAELQWTLLGIFPEGQMDECPTSELVWDLKKQTHLSENNKASAYGLKSNTKLANNFHFKLLINTGFTGKKYMCVQVEATHQIKGWWLNPYFIHLFIFLFHKDCSIHTLGTLHVNINCL